MKYEKANDLTTILVEPSDEAAFISTWVNERCDPARPVVMLLPVNGSQLFRSANDLETLRKLYVERADKVLLVIPGNAGNERLRTWACQQGFPVFSTVEEFSTYWQAQTLVQHSSLPDLVQQQAWRGAKSPARRDQRMPWISDTLQANGHGVEHPVIPVRTVGKPGKDFTTDELQPRPSAKKRYSTEPLIVQGGMVAQAIERRDRQDRLMVVLVVLLLLSILGGVGFGYLLTFTPTTLLEIWRA